jgi:hypothetical protein
MDGVWLMELGAMTDGRLGRAGDHDPETRRRPRALRRQAGETDELHSS